MKRLVSLLLSVVIIFSCCIFQTSAADENEKVFLPYVVDFSLTSPTFVKESEVNESRVSGLIYFYCLNLSVSGKNIVIYAETYCDDSVVKSGFKNLVVQRRKVTSGTWSDYYDYGDLYSDAYAASVNTTLAVESGYQYRATCKHYAKKNIFSTESISNTSNIVSV